MAFPLDRPSGNRLPGVVVDSLGGVTLWPDVREPIANAKLDAELFADVGAIIVMLMLVHGRWHVQEITGLPVLISPLNFAVALAL